MDKVPIAEEFIKKYNNHNHSEKDGCGCRWRDIVAMREFAKLHVQAALKTAAENVDFDFKNNPSIDTHNVQIDTDSILNAYDLNNIK